MRRSSFARFTAAATSAAVLAALVLTAPLSASADPGDPVSDPPTTQTEVTAPTDSPSPSPTTTQTPTPTPTTTQTPTPTPTATQTPTIAPLVATPSASPTWTPMAPCTAGTPVLDVGITDEHGIPLSDPAADKSAPTMADVEADKAHDTRATATISVSDPTTAANNIAPQPLGEIKGRGNFTWLLGNYTWIGSNFKRPYQIKFDKSTKVLGMNSAKTWVLLANATDASLMRNKVALDFARSIGVAYTSDSRFVDLRVDGTCYGSYLLTEKVEVKKNRVDLSNPSAVLIEQNNNMGDATNPIEDYYWRSSVTGTMYSLKDAKEDIPGKDASGHVQPLSANTQAGYDDMKASLTQLETLLAASSPDWNAISSIIDVDSFVKFYFVHELTENPEIVAASVYFYKNGPSDKIHAAPVWDFDSALFNYDKSENLGADPYSDYVKNAATLRKVGRTFPSSPLFQNLFRNQAFVDRANRLWQDGIGAAAQALPGKIDGYEQQLNNSAALNFTLPRSRILGKPTLLQPGEGKTYASTFAGEVSYLKARVSTRVNFLTSEYGTVPTLAYKGYVQNSGWGNTNRSGQIVGTTGQSLRMEAFSLSIANMMGQSGDIQAQSHVQNIGWSGWGSTGTVGTTGRGLRLEAVKLRLTGDLANLYDISYRVHVAESGWQKWVTNGAQAGTTGQNLRIEAIQVRLLVKPGANPQPCLATPPATISYVDVPTGYLFYNEIMTLANKGIMTGYDIECGKREFRVHSTVTREDMAGFLYRAAGSPTVTLPATSPFTDVPVTSPSYKEIIWLQQTGVTTGWDTPTGKEFRGSEDISREAMAAFMYRFAGSPTWTAPSTSPFVDVSPSSNIFYKEITWLADTGITTGWATSQGQEFRPKENIARDAMAAFIYRYMAKFP